MRREGQTERYDEVNGHFSQFCKRAYKLQVLLYLSCAARVLYYAF